MTDEELSFKDKIKTIGAIRSGGISKTRVTEYRDASDGHRIKESVDSLGHMRREHNTPNDRVDVAVNAAAAEVIPLIKRGKQ